MGTVREGSASANSTDITVQQSDSKELFYDDPSEALLVYSTTYKLVICKQCKFAIQPKGISRHLKDRHRIYRGRRQRLLNWVTELSLLEPDQVSSPPPTGSPIRYLGLGDGLSCSTPGCRYLCVSEKRMRQHWTSSHGRPGSPSQDWKSVSLQTFFRGSCSRYFVVRADTEGSKGSPLSISPPDSIHSEDSARNGRDVSEDFLSVELNGMNIDYFRLFKHYFLHTNYTLYHQSEPANFWVDTALQIAFQYPYLLNGLLSLAALRLAYLHEDHRDTYVLMARHQMDIALPRFRIDLSDITPDNRNAVLIFSRAQAVYTLASIQVLGISTALTNSCKNDPVETWTRLFRGNSTLWATGKFSLEDEPAGCLVSRPTIAEVAEISDHRMQKLYSEIRTLYQGTGESEELRTSLDTTDTLVRAFEHLQSSQSPARHWEAIEFWTCGLSDQYIHMIAIRRPAALVLLAHSCILLKHLERFWFVGNLAEQLLGLIKDRLDPMDEHLILWPTSEIR
jgi:hypothetical protein